MIRDGLLAETVICDWLLETIVINLWEHRFTTYSDFPHWCSGLTEPAVSPCMTLMSVSGAGHLLKCA